MDDLITALTTAVTTLQSDLVSAIGSVLPTLLTIGAIFIVIFAVWRLVKRFTK